MARRQNEDGGPLGLIILALAILGAVILTAAVYLPPIVFLLALLYFEFRAPRTPKDFALTDHEKHELAEYERYRAAIGINFQRIKEGGSDLKQNRDGSYHRGSKLGMQLNEELEGLHAAQEELDRREYSIRRRSHDMFYRWTRVISFQFALRFTMVAYLLSIAVLYALNPSFIESLSQFLGRHVLMRVSGVSDTLYGSVLVSSFGAGIFFWALYKIRRAAFERNAEALGACTGSFPDAEVGETTVTVTFSPSLAQDMTEMWSYRFEEIADAAARYQNGTYYEDEPDGEASDDEWEEETSEPEEEWYETLGVSPTASRREINEAWRFKMTRNHPDRVAELDPEFRALAEQRTKRLNAAREEGLTLHKRAG